MDVGYEAIMAPAKKVWLGVRTGFLSFPKVLNNFRVLGTTFDGKLPIDGLITNVSPIPSFSRNLHIVH